MRIQEGSGPHVVRRPGGAQASSLDAITSVVDHLTTAETLERP